MFLNFGVGRTLESLLDCKKIKLVNPKGNQSWIFTGRTVVEAEAPILWPPDAKNWLISSVDQLCLTIWNPMDCSMQGFLFHHQLPEFTQTHVHESLMPHNHLILCHPLLPPSIFPRIRVFSNESALRIRSPKYWSFSFSISPSNEYLGLISFRMDWLDLLAVQVTLKSLLQHHSSKAWVLWCSTFFIVQYSHPYMTTGKTITLTWQTFVGKVISLLCNMLPRLVIAFLPRSKCLIISWMQLPSTVILEPKKVEDKFN